MSVLGGVLRAADVLLVARCAEDDRTLLLEPLEAVYLLTRSDGGSPVESTRSANVFVSGSLAAHG